jgi:hypothetical protein
MTKRTDEILNHLYTFRFLTRNQIQTLLEHKHFNRIITWLNELTKSGYIRKYYNPKTITIPAIYSLGLNGRKYLKGKKLDEINEKLLDRVWREHTLSSQFQEHCIFLADCYLSLLQTSNLNQSKLHFYTKTGLHGMKYLILPHPDAYIAIEKGDQIQRYFLDIFDEMPPRMLLRKRVKQYIEYFEDEIWQEQTGKPFPKVILICPDEKSKNYLHRFIQSVLEDVEGVEFYLSTRKMVKEKGLSRETLKRVL